MVYQRCAFVCYSGGQCYSVVDKKKFWAGTYKWTDTKFRAAHSKFQAAKNIYTQSTGHN